MKRKNSNNRYLEDPERQRRHGALFLTILFCAVLGLGTASLLFLPKQTYSPREKHALSTFPRFTMDNLLDGSFAEGVETYFSDHFPLRESFVGLQAYVGLLSGRNGENGIYCGHDGWLLNAPIDADTESLRLNLESLNAFQQQTGLPATLLVVPSTGYMLPDELPWNHLPYPDASLLQQAQQQTANQWDWVDVQGALSGNAAQSYYHTDHHWTSMGAYLAYCAFAQTRGFTPLPENAFQKVAYPNFYGTTYAQSGYWLTPPDTIELWENPELHVQVEIFDDGVEGSQKSDSVFFLENLEGEDQYTVFLNGNHSLVRITNPQAAGGKLLILKDSFSHCLAPFLANHYQEIDLIDLRYYTQSAVSDLVQERGITEILACYGLDDLVNDANFTFLR